MGQRFNFRDIVCKQWFDMQNESWQKHLRDKARQEKCDVDDEDEFLSWIYHDQLGHIMRTIIMGDNN